MSLPPEIVLASAHQRVVRPTSTAERVVKGCPTPSRRTGTCRRAQRKPAHGRLRHSRDHPILDNHEELCWLFGDGRLASNQCCQPSGVGVVLSGGVRLQNGCRESEDSGHLGKRRLARAGGGNSSGVVPPGVSNGDPVPRHGLVPRRHLATRAEWTCWVNAVDRRPTGGRPEEPRLAWSPPRFGRAP